MFVFCSFCFVLMFVCVFVLLCIFVWTRSQLTELHRWPFPLYSHVANIPQINAYNYKKPWTYIKPEYLAFENEYCFKPSLVATSE